MDWNCMLEYSSREILAVNIRLGAFTVRMLPTTFINFFLIIYLITDKARLKECTFFLWKDQ